MNSTMWVAVAFDVSHVMIFLAHACIYLQLTVENFEEAVSDLTNVIAQSENSKAQQTSENLGTVANYFENLATFLTSSDINIDSNVGCMCVL